MTDHQIRVDDYEIQFLIKILESEAEESEGGNIKERRMKIACESLMRRLQGVLGGGRPRRTDIGELAIVACLHSDS